MLKDAGYCVWWGGKNDLVPRQDGFADYCDEKYQAAVNVPGTHDHLFDARRGEPGGDNYYSFHLGEYPPPGDPFYTGTAFGPGCKEGGEPFQDSDWGLVRGAIDFIQRYDAGAPDARPLCIFLPLLYPHPPYICEKPFHGSTDRRKLPPRTPAPPSWGKKPALLKHLSDTLNLTGWEETRWDELRGTYYDMCARVDEQFRRVLLAFKDAGLYDDTAAFFFSDHGDFTGSYGLVEKTQNTFEDCLTRVPFLIKPPKNVRVKPRVSGALVELIDFTATVYDFAGIDPGYDHFGRSLRPVLMGETDHHRDAVFCEGGRRAGETQCMEIGSNPDLDPRNWYYPRILAQREEGPKHSKAIMCRTERYKYVQRLYEMDELYDLEADPGELDNRIDDPALADIRVSLQERLLRFYLETSDVVPRTEDQR